MPDSPIFPRPDYATEDPRAWMHDSERELYDALTWPDITIEVTAKVELREKREARRTGGKAVSVPKDERDRREREASQRLVSAGRGAGAAVDLLAMVAQLRAHMLMLVRATGGEADA